MKYLGLLLISILLLGSCKDTPDELFEITAEIDVIFEAGINQFSTHFIDSYGIDSRINEILAANGRTLDEVTNIIPKSAEINNLQTNVSLDFIQNITLSVFDGDLTNPDLVENLTEIFFRDNVPQDRSTFIDLLPSLPDVKDQISKEKFNLRLRTQLRVPPPNTIEARLTVKFFAQ